MAMAASTLPLLILHALFFLQHLSAKKHMNCLPSTCSSEAGSLVIRYPFSLLSGCAYSPGFMLSCSEDNETIIELPQSVKLIVKDIDYEKETMRVYDPTCLLSSFAGLDISTSPFEISTNGYLDLSFFSCKSNISSDLRTCLGEHMYWTTSDRALYYTAYNLDGLISCKKMYDNSSIPRELISFPYELTLSYSKQDFDGIPKSSTRSKEKQVLGWAKLESIALGVAKGIEYLHQGCDQRILHFDIKPNNILLDQNFNPKVADFGLAKLCSRDQSAISMTLARGTVGYIAPEVFSRNFGNVSYKSDVYSFGMLLLEMVGVRNKNNAVEQEASEVYFPQWIYTRINDGEDLGIELDKGDEDAKRIAKKLTIVGLWCIQWDPMDRPSMKVVEQMLQGDGSALAVPPNPFASTNPVMVRSHIRESSSIYTQSLDVIVECE